MEPQQPGRTRSVSDTATYDEQINSGNAPTTQIQPRNLQHDEQARASKSRRLLISKKDAPAFKT